MSSSSNFILVDRTVLVLGYIFLKSNIKEKFCNYILIPVLKEVKILIILLKN